MKNGAVHYDNLGVNDFKLQDPVVQKLISLIKWLALFCFSDI